MSGAAKDFSCIGGLEKHIRIVKEMVLFPLMYGDVYAKFNLRPPRGLLFYGPPGNVERRLTRALDPLLLPFFVRYGKDSRSQRISDRMQQFRTQGLLHFAQGFRLS